MEKEFLCIQWEAKLQLSIHIRKKSDIEYLWLIQNKKYQQDDIFPCIFEVLLENAIPFNATRLVWWLRNANKPMDAYNNYINK